MPESKYKVVGLINERKKEKESCYLVCQSTHVPKIVVLIVVRSMNLRQYDHCHFLDHDFPGCQATGRTVPHLSSH